MPFAVIISDAAESDLEGLYYYIAEHDCVENAEYVFESIVQRTSTLTMFPSRGTRTKEALDLGEENCREIYFKPYRIVYEVVGETVNILVIADGRRDMKELLNQRLS